MKKKVISIMLAAAMTIGLLAGCGSSSNTSSNTAPAADNSASTETEAADTEAAPAASEGAKTYAIVTKSAGNPYNEREASGFEEVIKAQGGNVVVQHPESATADAQIAVVNSLISQGVDSIAIAANDANALAAVLQEAADAGIKVCSLDSDVVANARATFCNQAGVTEVGQALIDAVYDLCGGEGQYAILSATSQATNQNAWIDAMKSIAESDEKYAKIELVEVAYGDDEPQKSTDQTQALLDNYPDLKVIVAPTTVGIAAKSDRSHVVL